MANQANDRLARSLLDSSGREVSWPIVFAGVKNVVRSNNLNNDTVSCIKGWLKSNDTQLLIPLLGLTVLHTMSLNCSTVVRNQIATPKLLQRLEKQLARPQGPQVASALVQVLVDWAYLFGQEELGARSQALLDQARYRQLAVGCGPSPAVLAMQEELQLGLPPVAPIRGQDFVCWMYRGASLSDKSSSMAAGSSGGGGSGFVDWPSVLSGGVPGGAPPTITTAAVPELCHRMQADAQRMTSALAACRAAARMQRQTELTAAMDAAYREAERCSQWRRMVQDFTQRCDDPRGLSAVLSATDVINQALQHWQHFTGHEVYNTLRIAVPQPSAEMLRRTAAGSGSTRRPGDGGRGSEVADLLGMGHVATATATAATVASTTNMAAAVTSFQPQLPAQPQQTAGGGNPFGPARPLGAASQLPAPSNNPFAAPAPATSSQPARAVPVLAAAVRDWDPFAPAPPEAPVQPKPSLPPPAIAPPSSFSANGAANGAANGGGSGGGGNRWSAFPFDSAPSGVSWAGPQSPSMSLASPQACASAVFSPSAASAASLASAASTPSGGVASGVAAQPALTSPPQPPPPGFSYLQPFHDLLTPAAPAATPQQAATAAAAGSSGGGGGTRPAAGGGGAAAATAMASGHSAAAFGTSPHPTNGHAYAYAGSAAAAAGAAYPNVPAAGPSLSASAAAAPAARIGANRSSSSSGDGAAPVLDWQPEFERLASELRSLWAASASASASSPVMSPSPSSSSLTVTAAAAAAMGGGAAAVPPPLPAVLARVKGMCEALAAQHARHVAALAPQPPASASSEAAMLRDASSGALKKLREVASASAAAGAAADGAGPHGSGNGVGMAAGARGWVSFGPGGRAPPPVGPLEQHLIQQQQQLQQQQQQQQQGLNGIVHGSGRHGAADLSLI